MKNILTTLMTIYSGFCFSQINNYTFPKVISAGKNLNDFVPMGWEIRDSVFGDFDEDKLMDIAIVIQTKEALKLNDTTCFSDQPFFPKMLIVLLRRPDKTLRLSITATKLFGNCNWGVQGQDPFEKIENRRNTLGVIFLTGGTLRNYLSYYFRFQNNDWYLIGSESQQYWAGHTDEDGIYNEKLNFVTGVRETYNENLKRKRSNYAKTSFEQEALIKLSDFDDDSSIPFSDN